MWNLWNSAGEFCIISINVEVGDSSTSREQKNNCTRIPLRVIQNSGVSLNLKAIKSMPPLLLPTRHSIVCHGLYGY